MTQLHIYLLLALWVLYYAFWLAKANDLKDAKKVESSSSRILRLVAMVSVLFLFAFQNIRLGFLDWRFVPLNLLQFWIGFAVTACGLLFSIWARHYLGTNWSQAVTVKEDHKLITRGPYTLVRHPIYTGLLLALFGTAVVFDQWRELVAVVIAFSVLWQKLKLEEKWMVAEFGDEYRLYSSRTAALIPFIL